MKVVCFFGLILLCKIPFLQAQTVLSVADNDNGRCEPLEESIYICRDISPNQISVYLPNFRDHDSQSTAANEFIDFIELITSQCSPYVRQFFCGYYFPVCYVRGSSKMPVRLCRGLCEEVRNNCSFVLETHSNYTWPEFLDCSLDTFSCGEACFGPPELSECDDIATTSQQPDLAAPEVNKSDVTSILVSS